MSVFHNNVLAGAAGQGGAAADAAYVIPKSLRFNSGDSSHLNRTPSSAGNRRTWTWSAWVKRNKLGSQQALFSAGTNSSEDFFISFQSGDTFRLNQQVSGSANLRWETSQVFRDVSAWYHFVVVLDTTQATSTDRVKIYVNGSLISNYGTQTTPSQNATSVVVNSTSQHGVGRRLSDTSVDFDGLMADIQFVDGQALAPTDFGETRESDGVWVPKEASFTSPNDGTTWSSDLTATSGGAYFATGAGAADAFDGDLDNSAQSEPNGSTITFSPTGGITVSTSLRVYRGSDSTSNTVNVSVNGGSSVTFTKSAWVDLSFTGTLTSLAVSSPSANPGLSAVEVDGVILIDGAGTYGKNGFHLNFSDSSTNEALGFDSAPTTPDPDPKKGFDVVTYTGNGSTQNIGGLNFEPGLVWTKQRNTAKNHGLYDTVRGVAKRITSNGTNTEVTDSNLLTSFNPDGFSVGNDSEVNENSGTYVAWTWRAGGPAVSNTDGDVTSQVSVSTDYGFSIVKYTANGTRGAEIGHGLSAVPKWIIVKNLDQADDWYVYHVGTDSSNPQAYYLELNDTAGRASFYSPWDDTLPTSSVFSVGVEHNVNASGEDYIAYCWSEVSGFSKFDSYTGDGTSTKKITTGFKPRFLLVKPTSSTGNWNIFDSERPANTQPITYSLQPNLSNAEYQSEPGITFNDDGFTLNSVNTNGTTYIYAAFADRPGNNWDVNNLVTNEGLSTSKSNFDVVTYTGDGSSSRSIDSLAFQPDFVWIKVRNDAYGHAIFDSVRGANKRLDSVNSNAEQSITDGLSSFDSNGFTIGNRNTVGENNKTYVAWCWKAGGTAVSNTDGDLTASVSANAKYGFSIIKFTTASDTSGGATVGHGLGTQPSLYIYKPTSTTGEWVVVSSHDYSKFAYLNATTRFRSISSEGGGTPADPTNSVLSVYDLGVTLASKTYICYAFANVPGYQRVGSYTGNGSSTGPVIVTGFKPRFLLAKKESADGRQWLMLDSQRNPSNPLGNRLYAENTAGDDSADIVNFVDNGFEIISATSDLNDSGATYIYLAIGDDEIGSNEDCLVDVPNAVTADADATDTTGGYQRGNYATFNAIEDAAAGGNASLSNGNLQIDGSSSEQFRAATIPVSSGKWYFEIVQSAGTDFGPGVWAYPLASPSSQFYQNENYRYNSNGGMYNESSLQASYSSFAVGDVIGTALDMDNGKVYFSKNGVWQNSGDPAAGTNPAASGLTGQWIFGASTNGNSTVLNANFGQQRFKYPIPSGYAALNTTALPAATIEDGSAYFDATLYTGNNTSNRSITGLDFSPDLVWVKTRSLASGHLLFDTVRGAGEVIKSNNSNAELTQSNSLTAFNSDGFTIGSGTDSASINLNNVTYVGWTWDAGSSTVSNTDGSITSSVRANTSAGFSIVTFTQGGSSGQTPTVGHGLNAAPEMILLKSRGSTQAWRVYHSALGVNKTIALNLTDAAVTPSSPPVWSVSSSTFGAKNGQIVDANLNYVAYCFAPVAGYSAFGSYEGNGSSDGPFVALSFRPALIILKNADATADWKIYDSTRDPDNAVDSQLYPSAAYAESDGDRMDFLSNGFKLRTSGSEDNASGNTYIYYAVAENPFSANGGLAR